MREGGIGVGIPPTPSFLTTYHTHLGAGAHILTFMKFVSCSANHMLSSEHQIKPNAIIFMSQKRKLRLRAVERML